MPVIPVSSIDDSRLRPYRDVTSSNSSREMGLFVVEGKTLVEELLASNFPAHSVLVERQYLARIKSCVDEETPLYVLDDGIVEKLVGFNFHRGMLACGHRRPAQSFAQALPLAEEPATVVICVGVQDPENLGGILRNCAAFGVDAVILGPNCTDAFSRRVLRVSMGASLRLPISESVDFSLDLARLRDDWLFDVIASVLRDDATTLDDALPSKRQALLFGNEAHGLKPEWIKACSRRVTLPMLCGTDSLNVAVASGIFLYHFTRPNKRRSSEKPI
jgi:tRNA G18 (ribose-2'-O)-methylase SpoU